MQKTALITGVAGQDGSYLADFLLKKKYHIVGLTTSLSKQHLYRLAYFNLLKKITLIKGDVGDGKLMTKIIKKYQPDELYNLAGLSSVAKSWGDPAENFRINAGAVIELLDCVRTASPHTRFFQASSAEIYGQAKGVITEETDTFEPIHPYGVAKLAAHKAVKIFRVHYNLFAVNGILFNHESPLRDSHFVTKIIARGAAAIARGSKKKIALGNLGAKRDFAFAGDVVEAMWRMLQETKPSDFIICTGKTFSVADVAREALAAIGIKNWRSCITIVESRKRKHEVRVM